MATKDHYVSQFHLRQFIDPDSASLKDPWLWVGNLKTRDVQRRAPKNMAWVRGMFEGIGCRSDGSDSIETLLATEIEPAAAKAFRSFCAAQSGSRTQLAPALMRYVAWAAARCLPMASLFQEWAEMYDPTDGSLVEPPPIGWERISERPTSHTLEHSEFGVRENVPAREVESLIQDGWTLKFNRDDLLELVHMQAWYFQVRFFPCLRWVVLEAPEGKSFVIGDRPVVWGIHGTFDVKPTMLRHPMVQLVAPLSRSVALFAYHAESAPPQEIEPEQMNSMMALAANQWIAGSDEITVANAINSV